MRIAQVLYHFWFENITVSSDTINLRAKIQMMNNSKMECGKQWLNIYHSMAVKSAEILYSIPPDSVQFKRNETITVKEFTRFQVS